MRKQLFQNIGIVFSGSTISQAIFLVATIFLTRLYSPAVFGAFAIFLAWTNILGLLFTARYDTVIPLPLSSKETNNLLWGAGAISTCFLLLGTMLSLVICSLKGYDLQLNPFSVILGAYFLGAISLLHFSLIRWGLYSMLSGALILFALAVSGFQLGLYFISSAGGLVNGYLWGAGLTLLLAGTLIIKTPIERPNIQHIIVTLKKYFSIIKWSLPSGLLNTMTNNVQPLLIGLAFGNKEAGFFFLAYKLIGAPINLISGSISQVFFKEAAIALQRNDRQLLLTLLKNISFFMAVVLALFFIALFFLAGFLFGTFFGEEWMRSSLIVIWLIPYFLGKGFFHPVSFLAEALDKTKLELQFSLISFLNMMADIAAGYYFDSLKIFILIFSISTGVAYLFLWVIFFKIVSKGNYERKV